MNALAEVGTRVQTTTAVRVRYPECDRMGVVYHGNYFVWFEIGRTELMRSLGADYRSLEDRDGVFFPVIGAGVRYLAPARYDERLRVRTTLEEVGRVRVRFSYELVRESDEKRLAEGWTEHAAAGREGRARRLPKELRACLVDAVRSQA